MQKLSQVILWPQAKPAVVATNGVKSGEPEMPPLLEELGKLIPKETIDKFYDDAVSGPAKEVGKLGVDAVKAARLVLLPLQVAAAFQDRLGAMFERIQQRVPEDRQTKAPPELVGPALEGMRYLDDKSELWRMYEEVITKSVDSETAGAIHPSFSHIISQLSRDEAWILYRLRDQKFTVIDTLDLNADENKFENRKIEKSELPVDELFLPEQIELYYSHLESLSLVTWPIVEQTTILDANEKQTGLRRRSKMMLTDFGKLFVTACVPENGFEPKAKAPPSLKTE